MVDGKVAEHWFEFDQGKLFEQLGLQMRKAPPFAFLKCHSTWSWRSPNGAKRRGGESSAADRGGHAWPVRGLYKRPVRRCTRRKSPQTTVD